MAASFKALFEQLAPPVERPPVAKPRSIPAFGALAELLEARPRPAPAGPAFDALADVLTPAAPTRAPVGDSPVVLIACSDTKTDTGGRAIPAADLYASALFRKSLAYARAITTDENIRILSGLHGVLRTTDRIATYDFPIAKLTARERDDWGERAHTALLGQFGQKRPRQVVVLAGEEYVLALQGLTNPHRRDALAWTMTYPFGVARGARMQIGQRLRWLNDQLRALGREPAPPPKTATPRKPGRIRMNTRGRPWREVEALAWAGDFFVHVAPGDDDGDDDLFAITHAPTGRAWPQKFRDVRCAIAHATELDSPEARPVVAQLVDAIEKKSAELTTRHGTALARLLAEREPLRSAEFKRRYGQDPPAGALAPLSEREPQSQLLERSPAPEPTRAPFADLAALLGGAAAVPSPPPPSEARPRGTTAPAQESWSYLGTVGGDMVWPDVGTRVRWNEETTEHRGKVIRHGTRELVGTITRLTVDEMNPRGTDVWAKPDRGGAERRVGIGGIRIPSADLPAFTDRARHWFDKRMRAQYGESPPSPRPTPSPATAERRQIARFLVRRASTFASVWPRPGEVVTTTDARIADVLRNEAVAIERMPDVAAQTAHDARLAALRHLRSVAAKMKGKPGEAVFVAAKDIERGVHLALEEEPASSAPDPRRMREVLNQKPAPEPAKAPSFADLFASLDVTAPAAPLSVAAASERARIVAHLKREATASERVGAMVAATRLRAIADDVTKLVMPAADLRRTVVELLVTHALLKTAAELRESKHDPKGELAAMEAAEIRSSPSTSPAEEAPAPTVRSVSPLRQRIVDGLRAQSRSAEVLAGILGVDLAAVRAEIAQLVTSGGVYAVETPSEGPPEYMATDARPAVGADVAPAEPSPAPDLQAARLALPALPSVAQELRWKVIRAVLTSGRREDEIAELLGVEPALVREELGQLHAAQYLKRSRDPAGRVEYRADLDAIMRKRDARARELQASTPRSIALPRASDGDMLIEPDPHAPDAWRVAQTDASGRRTWHSRALSWADAVQAAVARDGDPRFASDRSPAPEPMAAPPASVRPALSPRASLEEAAWAATPERSRSTRRDGTRVTNYLNPASGLTESWPLTSLPIEELQRRARVAAVPAPVVEPADDEADKAIPSQPLGPVVIAVFSDGTEVLATPTGPATPPLARAYTSQALAEASAEKLGEGWDVIKRGRRWYVRRLATAPAQAHAVSAPAPTKTKPPTFAQVRKMLLSGLEERGWSVESKLKVPHASKGRDRIWFQPQAVYFASGMSKSLGDAHSLSSDMREFTSVDDLLGAVERYSQAAAPASDDGRWQVDLAQRRQRIAIARYLESVATLISDPRAAKLLKDIAEQARYLPGPAAGYATTVVEQLRAAAASEGAETLSILRRAAWGLEHGARGTTSAQAWANTLEPTPEEELEARHAEAARIEAALDRLRARFPGKKQNAVREMVRDAIRKVRESCVSPAEMDTQSADSVEKCDDARDALRAALAARARSLNAQQGDLFDGFEDPKDIAAAQAVVRDIEALSRRLESPKSEGFKVGDHVVGDEGEEGGTVVLVRTNGNVIVEHADGTRSPWTHWAWWRPAPAPESAPQPKEQGASQPSASQPMKLSEPVEITAARERAQQDAAELLATTERALEEATQDGADPGVLAARRNEKDGALAIKFVVHTPPENVPERGLESLARFAEHAGKRLLASYLRDLPPWPPLPTRREKILAYLDGRRGGAPLRVITAHVAGDGASGEDRERVVELLRQMKEEGVLVMRIEEGERWYSPRSTAPSPMLEALTRLLGDEAPAREVEAAIENAAQDEWWNNIVKTRKVYGAAVRLMHDDEALADQVLDIARQFQSQVLKEHPQRFVSRKAGEPPILAADLGSTTPPAPTTTEVAEEPIAIRDAILGYLSRVGEATLHALRDEVGGEVKEQRQRVSDELVKLVEERLVSLRYDPRLGLPIYKAVSQAAPPTPAVRIAAPRPAPPAREEQPAAQAIVVAWVTRGTEIVPGNHRADLGERPKTRVVPVAKAVVWVQRGTPADLEAARAYAAKQDECAEAYSYPISEPDPLDSAKRDALVKHEAALGGSNPEARVLVAVKDTPLTLAAIAERAWLGDEVARAAIERLIAAGRLFERRGPPIVYGLAGDSAPPSPPSVFGDLAELLQTPAATPPPPRVRVPAPRPPAAEPAATEPASKSPQSVSALAITRSHEAFEADAAQRVVERPVGDGAAADYATLASLHGAARDAHRAAAAVQGGSLFALHSRAATAHARAHEASDAAATAAREHDSAGDDEEPAYGKRAKEQARQRRAEERKAAASTARAARLASEAAATTANNLERAFRGRPAPATSAAAAEASATPAAHPAAAPSPPIQVEDLWTVARRRDANLAAMHLAAEMARDPRPLTDDERRTLALYSGWGGLSIEDVADKGGFPPGFPQPDSDALIHEYYTPTNVCAEVARVVMPLLDGVNSLAAADGYIHALEPSCGVGRFIRAFSGPGFENVRWHGVEYSPLSAAILRTLRPELDLYEGPFQRWIAEHEVDYGRRLNLVVSNPPYGDIGVEVAADRKRSYRESGRSPAYKYFLRRGLDLLAPGGLGVYLIPAGFLSGTAEGYPELREKVLLRHHLSCAYRLPGELFPGGHNPAFDLIFFRARPGTLEEPDPADASILEGRYYEDFPQNVLGEIRQNHGRWKTEAVVGAFTSLPDLVERPICQACAHLPFEPVPPPPANEVAPKRRAPVFTDARLASASTLGSRVNWFLAAIAAQESEVPALAWEELHRGLSDWAAHHGPPSDDADVLKLAADGDLGAQRFLNAFVRGTTKLIPGLATKPEFTPRYTGMPNDLVAKAEYLYRQHRRLAREDLGGAELAPLFAAGWCEDDDPALGPDRTLEPPDVYYFGQLWPKYDRAKARAALGNDQAARQAARLIELIRPAVFDDIRLAPPPPPAPKPDAPTTLLVWPPPPAWLPLDLLAEWIRHENPDAEGEIGLVRRDGVVKLVDETYDELGEGNYGGRTEVVNMIGWINHDKYLFGPAKTGAETLDEARMRVSKAWSQSFVAWAGATEDRRERIEQAYQRLFQGFRAPEYGSAPLNLARWYKGVTLAPHQNAGARRVLANRGGLVAFDVGVGKTYTGLAIIAGARQEGWVKRPVIVVPASIIWKWDRDIRKTLPDYRVGIIGSLRKTISRDTKKHKKGYETSETDSPADRAATWSRFQAGEYDVVLMTYEALARTQMREASVVEYARATAGIARRMTLRKRTLGKKKKLTEREEAVLKQGVAGRVAQLLELPETWKYDPGIIWEDIGIDLLMFDEAQRGKNLYLPEAREGGVPKYMGSEGEGSAIAWQMDFRCATVRANTGGAGIVLLSATPAKNSPLEFYNAIQLVDHDAWTKIGVTNPEQFIDIFCEIEVRHVVNTSTMTYVPQSVCSGFINLDMLRSVVFKYGEFRTAEEVGLPLPTPKVDIIEVDMTDEQEDKYSEYLDAIAEAKTRRAFGEAAGYRMRLPLVAIHVDLDEGYTWPSAATKVPKEDAEVETDGIVEPTEDGVVLSVRDALAIPRRVKKNVFGTSDPYKTLGLQRTATPDQISDAFRSLARQHHPDTNPGDDGAAARFKEINAAYQLLSDPHERAAYDHEAALGALAGDGKKKVIKRSAADVPNPHSPKLDALVKEVLARPHCGHIVFCDNISAHWWIKTCLEQAGIAPERIAVMNGVVTKEVAERQKIALAFNGDDGDKGDPARGIEPMPPIPPEFDVVIGNAIMHEGVDLQRRTCAIHHLDLPYEPSTLQQRNGRGHRQGNKFTEISILYYFARRSSDGGRYQLIKGKLGWMTALLDNQQRDTNNPGAQSNMTPEEEAIFESRDPEATRALIEAAKERHQAEVNAKIAHEASATLRGVADRFWRARNARDAEEAARMRAEGEQKLAELARVNPVAWPWMSWAVHAREVMMLVPPNGESPAFPGLRVAKPHFSDPTVKDYSEFGRTFEGKSIGIRRAGSPTWTELELAKLVAEKIKPEHLAEDWPEDDDDQIAELMRTRLLPRLAQSGLSKDVWNTELQWHWASPQFIERQWPRFGEEILAAWKRLPSHWQGELKVPVITNGVLSVGILRPFDSALPPTDDGYADFLRLALPSKATWGDLDEAARFWWGRSIPRNLVATREPEKKPKAEPPAPAAKSPEPAPVAPPDQKAPQVAKEPKAPEAPQAPQAPPAESARSHVHRSGEKLYGDTRLLDLMGQVPGFAVRHLGMGEFVVATPLGDIEFDRMRGVDFPGQSGRSHLLYGEPKALAAALEALGLGDLVLAHATPAAAEPAEPVKRPMGEYKKLPQTGAWGIAVPGPAPKPGEKITVTTRKGKVKTEVVDRVVGSGFMTTGIPATLCSVVE